VLFFLAVVATIPSAVGPDLNLLARIGPAILWIGALLASLLGLDRLFQADREDGSLDLLIIAATRTCWPLTVLAKCLAHWTARCCRWSSPRTLFGLLMNMDAARHRRHDADAAGRHAGDRLRRRGGCGGGRGAAARRTADLGARPAAGHPGADLRRLGELRRGADPEPFLQPFLMLSALTLLLAVIGPVAAAAALRWSAD
jgi:heme exporter protein B